MKKAEITAVFKDNQSHAFLPENALFVIDGGYLLRKYIWDSKDTFQEICDKYIKSIKEHYGILTPVVFDGYGTNL